MHEEQLSRAPARSVRPDPWRAELAPGPTVTVVGAHTVSDPRRGSESCDVPTVVDFCATGMRVEAHEAEAAASRCDAAALEGALDRSRWLLTLLGRAVRRAREAPGGSDADLASGSLACLVEFARLIDAADTLRRSDTTAPR